MIIKGTRRIGQLIRRARIDRGLTQRALAAQLGVRSGSYVGMLESGLCKGIGLGRLQEIASFLAVRGVERYRWMAAAGHLPPTLVGALIRRPERWDEILSRLDKHRARTRKRRENS